MKRPIYVTRPYLPDKAAFDRLTGEIWDHQWLTNQGPLLLRFHERLARYLGLSESGLSLTVNGHTALEAAIRAMGLRGEVITTPFTFASTTHAIVQCGLRPVFCDIDPVTYTLDPARAEALITPETSAILPVHVYGHPCDVRSIDAIAKAHGLRVLYDAAHAFGVRLDGESIAGYGDAAIFSFHATKLFHSIEGGALCARDPDLIRRADLLKNFGIENETTVSCPGGNGKMNEFQAAMGLLNLEAIDRLIDERRDLTRLYAELLDDVPGIRFQLPEKSEHLRCNYAYFPVLVTEAFPLTRDGLYDELMRHEIYTRRYFYPLTSRFECYRDRFPHGSTPVADDVAAHVLALPIYNGLSPEEIGEICELIRSAGVQRKGVLLNDQRKGEA